ncbi:hypothetical protein [Paenibacillus endoradicis]|uniref:hypothetical protein n=1 Tax=Paenibacillus endoradicis TaxID=2972487 RepID=UPI002158FE24|nr:hypothetical protein [Paenibacillus endoradicis]MCR8656051.1 hypothetical protein [Paenibacillus endoradicis]MCR8658377.1 hypothetical protein [Paenibacillus endoradicis]
MKDIQQHSFQDQTKQKIERILDSTYPLSRDDVVWMLGYITKKVADEDPAITGLSQPQLLQNFHAYAEVAMALIGRRNSSDQEAERLRQWLRQASQGLLK